MITQEDISQVQKSWGQAVVKLGRLFVEGGDYAGFAEEVASSAYAYDDDVPVLFKPTKCKVRQFRPTKAGAVSYFVGGNDCFPEDQGFALQPWVDVTFHNTAVNISPDGSTALTMGNYFFTKECGEKVKVEYSFGYQKINGTIKIVLHHSSLPYSG